MSTATLTPPTKAHPAQFSREILDALRECLRGAPWVHDPFAGPGERLGALCDELGVPWSGTELEEPYIVRSDRVIQGDSRDPDTYPPSRGHPGRWWVVTSPVYPNGMADHFTSSGECRACGGTGVAPKSPPPFLLDDTYCTKCRGTGRREHRYRTYRHAAAEITGDPGYQLHEQNMGRYSLRRGATSSLRYWEIAEQVAVNWAAAGATAAHVNVKDFHVGARYVPLADEWVALMERLGWQLTRRIEVECPGMRFGANRERRVDREVVLVFAYT